MGVADADRLADTVFSPRPGGPVGAGVAVLGDGAVKGVLVAAGDEGDKAGIGP